MTPWIPGTSSWENKCCWSHSKSSKVRVTWYSPVPVSCKREGKKMDSAFCCRRLGNFERKETKNIKGTNHLLTFCDTMRKVRMSSSFSTSIILMLWPWTLRVPCPSLTSSYKQKQNMKHNMISQKLNKQECKISHSQSLICGHRLALKAITWSTRDGQKRKQFNSDLTIIVRIGFVPLFVTLSWTLSYLGLLFPSLLLASPRSCMVPNAEQAQDILWVKVHAGPTRDGVRKTMSNWRVSQ